MKMNIHTTNRIPYKILAIVSIFLLYLFLQKQYSGIRPEMIRDLFVSFGVYGPLIFFSFAIIRPLVLFPITAFYLASGLAFGPFWGGVLSSFGAAAGALVAHGVAKKTGVDFLPIALQEKIELTKSKMDNNSFQNMLMIRFIPLISFDFISYASGMARVQRGPYIAATIIGITPRVFAYTYLGSNIININDPNFWIAFSLLLLIFATPIGLYKKLRHH